MKASQIQQQLAINADVLTGLHQEYAKLRQERKRFNAMGDAEKAKSNNAATLEEVEGFSANAEVFYAQAEVYTPYIKRFAAKIAKLAAIQVTLKHEVKCASCLGAWSAQDFAEWESFEPVALSEYVYDGWKFVDGKWVEIE